MRLNDLLILYSALCVSALALLGFGVLAIVAAVVLTVTIVGTSWAWRQTL